MDLINLKFYQYFDVFLQEASLLSDEETGIVSLDPEYWAVSVNCFSLKSFIENKSYLTSSYKPSRYSEEIPDDYINNTPIDRLNYCKNKNLEEFKRILNQKVIWEKHSKSFRSTTYINTILSFLEETEIVFRFWFKKNKIDFQKELKLIPLIKFKNEIQKSDIAYITKGYDRIKNESGVKSKFGRMCEDVYQQNYKNHKVKRRLFVELLWAHIISLELCKDWKQSLLESSMQNAKSDGFVIN